MRAKVVQLRPKNAPQKAAAGAIVPLLQDIIIESGMSQTTIAREAEVSWQTVHRMLVGDTRNPQFRTVASVARACGWRMGELIREVRQPEYRKTV